MSGKIFKSINIQSDIESPNRLMHYYPTAKTMSLIQAILLGEKTAVNFIVAPYGSGKSLASSIAALFVSNNKENKQYLDELAKKFQGFDTELSYFSSNRSQSGLRGKAVVLYGFEGDLLGRICDEFSVEKNEKLSFLEQLDLLKNKCFSEYDRVAFIWDEFGRHLERLVDTGQSYYLDQLQTLAEWCSRQQKTLCTFNVLMHQAMTTYSSRLTQSLNNEWKKVGGRFNTIRFVDRSKDVYLLLANMLKNPRKENNLDLNWLQQAKILRSFNWFFDFRTDEELKDVLRDVWPLSGPVLHVLPTISSRLGQNERSLFDFLQEYSEVDRTITLEDVYKYFSPQMREDVAHGGFYRRWLECESARSKCSDKIEKEILASVALLQLGVHGERIALYRDNLEGAIQLLYPEQQNISKILDSLENRHLLLNRMGSVSIWHGIDIDLRNKISEKEAYLKSKFDLFSELKKHFPLKPVLSHEYNVDWNISRYVELEYVSPSEVQLEDYKVVLDSSDDGKGRFVFVQNLEEQKQIVEYLKSCKFEGRVVHIVSEVFQGISKMLLELKSLDSLLQDQELLKNDPLVEKEIHEMYNQILKQLNLQLDSIGSLDPDKNLFFLGNVQVEEGKSLSKALSGKFEEEYPQYFKIANETFVRKEISRSMSNARRKLQLSIFEYWSVPFLGHAQSTSVTATAYRTILNNTGIVRTDKAGVNHFYDGNKDNPLHFVWSMIEDFFQTPGEKELSAFISTLQKPPFGVRGAIIPILFSVGWKHFAKQVAIYHKGAFVNDVLGSTIEDLFKEPGEVSIKVLNANSQEYLDSVIEEFKEEGAKFSRSSNNIIAVYDYIEFWKKQLPASALLGNPAFREEVRKIQHLFRNLSDPVEMFFIDLPQVFGLNIFTEETMSITSVDAVMNEENLALLLKNIEEVHLDIDSIIEGYTKEAVSIILRNIVLPNENSNDNIIRIQNWANCFQKDSVSFNKLNGETKSFLKRTHSVRRYNPASFARALSSLLLGKSFEDWDSRSAKQFEEKVRSNVKTIQREYLEYSEVNPNMKPYIINTLSSSMKNLTKVSNDIVYDVYGILNRCLSQTEQEQLVEFIKNYESRNQK